MNATFPFGFPGPTAFYLTAYVATLVIHLLFMNYVMAGCGYLVVAGIRADGLARTERDVSIAAVLRDWMPFAVSAAITAGVAPLLFIQILYRHPFYTANLLLFHRWMAILPALIAGFYLLYVFRSERVLGWSPLPRVLVILGAFACFGFTGWSWSENHLLGLRSGAWAELYGSSAMTFRDPELLPRIAVWLLGSIPTLSVLVAWQLHHLQSHGKAAVKAGEPRRLALFAMAGLALTIAAGGWYYGQGGSPLRTALTGQLAGPYAAAAFTGMILQGAAWAWQWRGAELTAKPLAMASTGVVLTLCGAAVVREARRLQSLDASEFFEEHRQAFAVGGLWVFLAFFLVNAGLICFCVWIVKRETRRAPAS